MFLGIILSFFFNWIHLVQSELHHLRNRKHDKNGLCSRSRSSDLEPRSEPCLEMLFLKKKLKRIDPLISLWMLRFKMLDHQMSQRRENTAAVTVDSKHFKQCKFWLVKEGKLGNSKIPTTFCRGRRFFNMFLWWLILICNDLCSEK